MESSISELVFSGVKLMVIGMGIVYLFLALLVWIITMTSQLINRYAPEPPPNVFPPGPSPSRDGEISAEAELVAVIGTALHLYQNKS